MIAQDDSIECGDTHLAEHPTYSAPRLKRLGRVSELTEANGASNIFDGNGYTS